MLIAKRDEGDYAGLRIDQLEMLALAEAVTRKVSRSGYMPEGSTVTPVCMLFAVEPKKD